MSVLKPVSISAAALAVASMASTPVLAAEIPLSGSAASAQPYAEIAGAQSYEEDTSDYHRRYRRYRRGVDAGDVLAGVLIIGGIAAIANAASKNSRDRDERYRDRDYRYREPDYRDRRDERRYDDPRGIDGAVSRCLSEIERDVRVDQVDSVRRTGEGWQVDGRLYNGDVFTCRIGNDGRIDGIDFNGRELAYAAPTEDRQWSDDRYAAARARMDRQAPPQRRTAASEPQPAYPGGPVDGDFQQDAPASGDDGRYDAHETPDFSEA